MFLKGKQPLSLFYITHSLSLNMRRDFHNSNIQCKTYLQKYVSAIVLEEIAHFWLYKALIFVKYISKAYEYSSF